jgi:hypothetical protein
MDLLLIEGFQKYKEHGKKHHGTSKIYEVDLIHLPFLHTKIAKEFRLMDLKYK